MSHLISKLLEKTKQKQEDESDKIEMLKKIEMRVHFLFEAREHIANGKDTKKTLEDKEAELHKQRRDRKIFTKKQVEKRT
jgi:hypothetical protein